MARDEILDLVAPPKEDLVKVTNVRQMFNDVMCLILHDHDWERQKRLILSLPQMTHTDTQ
jgi:hypothetical protein